MFHLPESETETQRNKKNYIVNLMVTAGVIVTGELRLTGVTDTGEA